MELGGRQDFRLCDGGLYLGLRHPVSTVADALYGWPVPDEDRRRPRLIGEEPDYLPPYDPDAVKVHRSRRFCRPPAPPKPDSTVPSHIEAERNRLYRRWCDGTGWDYRQLRYGVAEVLGRCWKERLEHFHIGEAGIMAILRRARIHDPLLIRRSGRLGYRLLTEQEMRRVVTVAMQMRAQRRLARE